METTISQFRPAHRPQVVIVTGAAGYIGSHVCEALLHRGDAVIGIDCFTPHYDPARKRSNLAEVRRTAALMAGVAGLAGVTDKSKPWPHGNFHFVEGDVRRATDLDEAFRLGAAISGGHPVRRVLHLAARAGVRGALSEAAEYTSLNVDGTVAVLDACRRHGLGELPATSDQPLAVSRQPSAPSAPSPPGHLVIASSSTVYGSGPAGWDGPFSEDMATDEPLSIYGATKRACELLAGAFSRLAGLNVTCLRYFGVVGPRARADLSPYVFTDAVWHGRPINKFGDGSTARDYTYVGDIVRGTLAALDRFELAAAKLVEPGGAYECINLGNDRPVTLNDYLATLERLIGKPVIVNQMPEHPMDAKRTWADLAKARRLLGYAPATSFEAALKTCVDWYVTHVAGKARAPAPAAATAR